MMRNMKIRFNSDDDSPLVKTLELSNMLMVIKYVFHEGSKFYHSLPSLPKRFFCETITGAGDDAAAKQAEYRNKGAIFKNCAPFIYCKSEINNTEIGNAKDTDVVMPIIIPKYLEIYGSITKMSPR